MFSTFDRYLIRQAIPPILLALGVFTFVLAVQPMLDKLQMLLAKGVPLPTVGVLITLLLPSALALTIPMAFLTGLLMALGRLSGDRESVALLACGVSPLRVLRPVLALGVLVGAADMYVLMQAVPDANQAYRDIAFRLLTEQTAADIKPRVFFTQFPGKVLYVRDVRQDGTWAGVVLADTSDPARPTVTLAEAGRLVIEREARLVRLVLEEASKYEPGRADPRVYTLSRLETVALSIPPESVFGVAQTVPGLREMSFGQLRAEIARKRAEGTPAHPEIMQLQQMFSFPAACLVFAAIGLAVGLNTRKEGRLAGLTLGLVVILIYYAVFAMAEASAKGVARTGGPVDLVATWARWIPNLVLGALAGLALWVRTRPPTGFDFAIRLPAWVSRIRADARDGGRARPAGANDRPTVVLRVPRVDVPLPRILDRYVGRHFLGAVSLAFLGLLALYYIGAFLDLAEKLFKAPDGFAVFAAFAIHSTPQFLMYVIPVSILIAVLGTIGGLTRSSELVVMRACGVSLYRTALPLLAFALVGSALLFGIEESVLGEANRVAADVRDSLRDQRPTPVAVSAATSWMMGDDGRIYAYGAFGLGAGPDAGQPVLQGVSVFATASGPFRLRSHTYVERARFDGGAWQGASGWVQTFTGDASNRQDFGPRKIDLPPVADFQRAEVDPSTMTFGQYREYVRRLGASGFNVAEQRVNLHAKVAFPFVTVVMTLLAVPFGVTIGRKGALYGIGLATVLAAAYYLLQTVFLASGSAGLLPPMLAAWGANVIFAAAAAYVGLTVRT